MSHWVLQKGLEHEAGWLPMVETLERFGISHSFHTVTPFSGELEPEPAPSSDEVICMGSYSMRHTAKRRGWNPGVFDLEPYDFSMQIARWGVHMLNADAVVASFAKVRFDDGPRFVRPVDDSKAFAGRVFEPEEFSQWQRQVAKLDLDEAATLSGDTRVLVAKPTAIGTEIRCWIVGGRVVTASIYRVGERVIYSDRVEARYLDFAGDRAAEWSPEKAFCLDVCDVPDGLRVVEINTINSAGLYAADTQKLVAALDGVRR